MAGICSYALSLRVQAQASTQGEISLYVRQLVPLLPGRTNVGMTGLAKFEPAKGCYLGAYIDLDPQLKSFYRDQNGSPRRLPEEFEALAGRRHAMYFFYLGYGKRLPLDWVKLLARRGKFVHVALEPNSGLDKVKDDEYLRQLADDMRKSKARIFLRFASEMNGDWTKYSGNPAKYKEKFRLVAQVMRKRATNVAMVWAVYTTPRGNIPQYYPGDEFVDWVGVNMYNVTYFNQNPNAPASQVRPGDMLDYIYKRYSRAKPIMISEYATTHFSALENKPVIPFAISNIRTLYRELQTKYPRVKAINYFNSDNLRLQHRKNNDYTVTDEPQVLATYRQAIGDQYFIEDCNQTTAFKQQDARLLRDGDTLAGPLKLSARVNSSERYSIRFLLDGVELTDTRPGLMETSLKADSIDPGARRLTAVAYSSKGLEVARTTVTVNVVHTAYGPPKPSDTQLALANATE